MNTVDLGTNVSKNTGLEENNEEEEPGLANFLPLPNTNPSSDSSPSVPSLSYYSLPKDGANTNLGNSYYHAYSDKSKMGNIPYYSMDRMRNSAPTSNPVLNSHQDKILEKLNKMIYLLEEQQNEPTKHITEEFILYTFLGVFIIFIVDSFSKTGKYTR